MSAGAQPLRATDPDLSAGATQADSLAALAFARADTIAGLQWLLEDTRAEAARALSLCEERADSLQIELSWTQRLADQQSQRSHSSPVWAALGSRTAVFCYGFIAGTYTAVQVMHAVD